MKDTPPPKVRKRHRHSKEFKLEAVRLAKRPDVGFAQAAQDLGVLPSQLYRWAQQLTKERDEAFRGNGNRTTMEAELARLRSENAILREERDILKKAATYFAKESE